MEAEPQSRFGADLTNAVGEPVRARIFVRTSRRRIDRSSTDFEIASPVPTHHPASRRVSPRPSTPLV
jgi:hypothetical protein